MKKRSIRIGIVILSLFYFIGYSNAQEVNPETALKHYLHNDDNSFQWELKDSFSLAHVTAYNLLLTSQKWRQYTWKHQLTVLVPNENKYDGALLFITGGSLKDDEPRWNGKDDEFAKAMGQLAIKNKAIVSILRQTPNQPLYDNLTEDALISFTLHNFKNDGDYTWPLLFPMVKSAVRAMDAVQQFSKKNLQHDVKRFVVSGASKRGWTTWLTGAHDDRVAAIAPMVIDILNMPVSLDYQVKVWKDYSIQIEDYVKLGIPQGAHTKGGAAINDMVDPYSYRKKLTMPKMIIMGTNDEYWVIDNIKNYLDSIPGLNLIKYVPNVGHDLGDKSEALAGLSAFFGATIANRPYSVCTWKINENKKGINLKVKASADALVDVIVWSADSEDMDFRNETWSGKSLKIKNKSVVDLTQDLPKSGYRAFYVDLKYKDPNGGEYTESTRAFMTDTKKVL